MKHTDGSSSAASPAPAPGLGPLTEPSRERSSAFQRPSAVGERLRRIASLGLPIIGGMISQNIFNLVDTAMVGHLGDAALAAVGTASFLHFLAVSWLMGLGNGVQAIAARRLGEGEEGRTALPLNGALLLSLLFALPVTVGVFIGAPSYFPWVNDTPAVVQQAVPYMQLRAFSLLGAALNVSFRGYWNGVHLSRLYLQTLLVMHASNIAFNYTFIFGNFGMPAMGTAGAGLGSALATYIGTGYYFFLGLRYASRGGFLRARPSGETIRAMLRLAIPAGAQQLFFAGGFTVMFWILGQVGTAATAAANVLTNLMLVAVLPAMALGMAAATLVSQSLGQGRPQDATGWGWDVAGVAVALMALLSLPMLFVPDSILGLFIHNPQTIAISRLPLRVFAVAVIFDAVGIVFLHALSGAGAVRFTMLVSIACQWLLFLPAAYLVGPVLGYGLTGVWIAQCTYRLCQAAVFVFFFRRGSWRSIRL